MKSEQYNIVPLSDDTLNKAVSLIKNIFPYKKDQRDAEWSFTESLSKPDADKKYWLAVKDNGKVIGITGLYTDAKDSKTVWLGWFGVHPQYRRQGIGSQLLESTISEAIKRGFAKLKLYTSSDKNEVAAHSLYRKFGFVQSGRDAKGDVIYFEKMLEESMEFTIMAKKFCKPSKHKALIDRSISRLQEEIELFIQEMKEVPWLYNERALLGLYISGLVRDSNTVVLQEFVCGKGKTGRKRGRGDLLFINNNEGYLVEAKLWRSSIKTKSDFSDAYKWAKKTLKQAIEYSQHEDFKWEEPVNVFSLCFESVWCSKNNLNNFERDRRLWTEDCEIKESGLDFYYFIHSNEREIKEKKHIKWNDNYFHPAVAVYGVFNSKK